MARIRVLESGRRGGAEIEVGIKGDGGERPSENPPERKIVDIEKEKDMT